MKWLLSVHFALPSIICEASRVILLSSSICNYQCAFVFEMLNKITKYVSALCTGSITSPSLGQLDQLNNITRKHTHIYIQYKLR